MVEKSPSKNLLFANFGSKCFDSFETIEVFSWCHYMLKWVIMGIQDFF